MNDSNFDAIKKYKQLLDMGVITQEEFEAEKKLFLDTGSTQSPIIETKDTPESTKVKVVERRSVLGKRNSVIVVSILLAVAVLLLGFFLFSSIRKKQVQSKRASALESAIESIMDDYNIRTFEVRYVDNDYEVFAQGFDLLSNGNALDCLKELDKVTINDPCGDGEIDFGPMCHVHPGLDVEYSYWRVPSYLVFVNQQYGGYYTQPGIYCNLYGSDCVYPCDN